MTFKIHFYCWLAEDRIDDVSKNLFTMNYDVLTIWRSHDKNLKKSQEIYNSKHGKCFAIIEIADLQFAAYCAASSLTRSSVGLQSGVFRIWWEIHVMIDVDEFWNEFEEDSLWTASLT